MSTVIKRGQAGTLLRRLCTVDLADHLAEADAVVTGARRQASQIVQQATGESQRAYKEAKKAGYEAGFEQGHTEGSAAGREAAHREATQRFNREHADIVAAMQQAVAALDAVKEQTRIAAERDVLELALQITKRLTFEIGSLDREAARANLCRAIDLVGTKSDLCVRIHPDDYESIKTFADSVLKQASASRAIRIVSDDAIAPGGCRVSGDHTEVDATLETQLNEVVSLLLGRSIGDG